MLKARLDSERFGYWIKVKFSIDSSICLTRKFGYYGAKIESVTDPVFVIFFIFMDAITN